MADDDHLDDAMLIFELWAVTACPISRCPATFRVGHGRDEVSVKTDVFTDLCVHLLEAMAFVSSSMDEVETCSRLACSGSRC